MGEVLLTGDLGRNMEACQTNDPPTSLPKHFALCWSCRDYKDKMKHQEPVGEEIVLSVLNLGNLLKYWKGEKQKVCSVGHTNSKWKIQA